MKKLIWSTVLILLVLVASCGRGEKESKPQYCNNVEVRKFLPDSPGFFTYNGIRRYLLPNGDVIYPAGTTFYTGGYPMVPFVTDDGNFVVVTDNDNRGNNLQKISVYDLRSGKIFFIPAHTFRGVYAWVEGGFLKIVYGGGWKGTLEEVDLNIQSGEYNLVHSLSLEGFISDIVVERRGRVVYASNFTDGKIWKVSLDTWQVERIYHGKGAIYDAVLTPDGKYLIFSDWTGQSIYRQDLVTGKVTKLVVGKFPEGIVLGSGGEKGYVAVSGEDKAVEFDWKRWKRMGEIELNTGDRKGLYPSEVTLCSERNWLLVSNSQGNYISVIDTKSNLIVGKIPTLWYPTGIVCDEKHNLLVFASAKGFGGEHWSGSPEMSQWNLTRGIVTYMQIPDEDELEKLSKIVDENLTLEKEKLDSPCTHPETFFRRFPIYHVVLIVRENKTYDEDLGDLETGNGDPSLTLFGERVTPNLHQLAREFTNCDNFYSNPEVSLEGHVWTTHADITDYLDKSWQNLMPFAGVETAATAVNRSFFHYLYNLGIDFRVYGEVAGVGTDLFTIFYDHVDMKFPFYNLDIPDVEKAAEFIRELKLGILKPFTYISLPNDHTYGYYPGKPTPESMVADNDEATGMIVDAISHSPFWKNTLIFIIEDDPQSFAGDHVEAHRSVCVAAGPYVKRHYTSHYPYSIPSIYSTIELLFGIPHFNRNTEKALPFFDIFTDKPDLSSYSYIERKVPVQYVPEDHPLAEMSREIFRDIDDAPGLGFILWKGIKGDVTPPPYAVGIDR